MKILQTERHCKVARAGQEEQRTGEIVPCPQEGENGDGCQDRRGERQDDPGEDLPFRRSIDARGIAHLLRDGAKELAQQEDIVGVGKEGGNDQWQERIAPMEIVVEEQIQRDHRYLEGQHHGRQDDDEENVTPGELDPRKSIGDRCIRDTGFQ